MYIHVYSTCTCIALLFMFLFKLNTCTLHRVTLLHSDVATCVWANFLLQFLWPWPAGQDWTALIPLVPPLTRHVLYIRLTVTLLASNWHERYWLRERSCGHLWFRRMRSLCTGTNGSDWSSSMSIFFYSTAITFYQLLYHLLDFYLSNYLIIWAHSKVYFWLKETEYLWYVAIPLIWLFMFLCKLDHL